MFLLLYILRCQLYVVCFAVLCVLGRCRVWCVSFCVCCVFCVASSALSIHSFIHFLGFSKSVLLVFLISRSRPYAFSRMMIAAFLLFSIFRFPDSWISWFFDFQIFSFLVFSISWFLDSWNSWLLQVRITRFIGIWFWCLGNFANSQFLAFRIAIFFRFSFSCFSCVVALSLLPTLLSSFASSFSASFFHKSRLLAALPSSFCLFYFFYLSSCFLVLCLSAFWSCFPLPSRTRFRVRGQNRQRLAVG